MLVLSRRIGETLNIGEEITLTVLGISGNQVRVGIEAPKEVNIVRSELLDPNRQQHQHQPRARNYLRRGY